GVERPLGTMLGARELQTAWMNSLARSVAPPARPKWKFRALWLAIPGFYLLYMAIQRWSDARDVGAVFGTRGLITSSTLLRMGCALIALSALWLYRSYTFHRRAMTQWYLHWARWG